jgi:hypothetical protein
VTAFLGHLLAFLRAVQRYSLRLAYRMPVIDSTWSRAGWRVEGQHMPGSYRMLAIWAASFVSIPFTVTAVGPGLSAVISVAGLVTGAAVYMRCSRSVPASEGEWGYEDTQARPWRSIDRLPLDRPAIDTDARPLTTVNTGRDAA